MDHNQRRPQQLALPTNAYDAARRYLTIYETSYPIEDEAQRADMRRLRNKCEAYIYFLRKAAPKFYREKLPGLINQVGSILLNCDIGTEEGQAKVHSTHATFLLILQDLRKTQPAGQFDFYTEKTRFEEKAKLMKRLNDLKEKLSELGSLDFRHDEIGNWDEENKYNQTFSELELLRSESRRVALEIAYLNGDNLEEEVEFELRFNPSSLLNRLTDDQLAQLEFQLAELYKRNHKRRDAIFVDKAVIDEMFENLDIDMTQFKKVDIHDMVCDALDAYKSFRREQDTQREEEYYSMLLENERLKPKDGEILADPDDIPANVRAKLDQNDRSTSRTLSKIYEEYGAMPNIDEALGGDQVSSSDESDGMAEVIESIRQRGIHYARVKEELSDDEEFKQELLEEAAAAASERLSQNNNANIATTTTTSLEATRETLATTSINNNDNNNFVINDKVNGANVGNTRVSETQTDVKKEILGGDVAGLVAMEGEGEDSDDSDDIQCLGTVEPKDKVKTFDID